MLRTLARTIGTFGVFAISLLFMAMVCTVTWDLFVNGKLYYCTDGGTLDFLFVGDWVHHPESVAHVVPRPMSEPDEIKNGWSITGLWCLWAAFVIISVFISALFARLLWTAAAPNMRIGYKAS
jgi:hypothetical protein